MSTYFSPGENPAYDLITKQTADATKALHEQVAARHARQLEEIKIRKQLPEEEAALQELQTRMTQELERERQKLQQLKQAYVSQVVEQRRKIIELRARLQPDAGRKLERQHAMTCRTEAQAAGAKTYLTGLPCRNGHVAPRYVSSGACSACDAMYTSPGYTKRRQPKQAA